MSPKNLCWGECDCTLAYGQQSTTWLSTNQISRGGVMFKYSQDILDHTCNHVLVIWPSLLHKSKYWMVNHPSYLESMQGIELFKTRSGDLCDLHNQGISRFASPQCVLFKKPAGWASFGPIVPLTIQSYRSSLCIVETEVMHVYEISCDCALIWRTRGDKSPELSSIMVSDNRTGKLNYNWIIGLQKSNMDLKLKIC